MYHTQKIKVKIETQTISQTQVQYRSLKIHLYFTNVNITYFKIIFRQIFTLFRYFYPFINIRIIGHLELEIFLLTFTLYYFVLCCLLLLLFFLPQMFDTSRPYRQKQIHMRYYSMFSSYCLHSIIRPVWISCVHEYINLGSIQSAHKYTSSHLLEGKIQSHHGVG